MVESDDWSTRRTSAGVSASTAPRARGATAIAPAGAGGSTDSTRAPWSPVMVTVVAEAPPAVVAVLGAPAASGEGARSKPPVPLLTRTSIRNPGARRSTEPGSAATTWTGEVPGGSLDRSSRGTRREPVTISPASRGPARRRPTTASIVPAAVPTSPSGTERSIRSPAARTRPEGRSRRAAATDTVADGVRRARSSPAAVITSTAAPTRRRTCRRHRERREGPIATPGGRVGGSWGRGRMSTGTWVPWRDPRRVRAANMSGRLAGETTSPQAARSSCGRRGGRS